MEPVEKCDMMVEERDVLYCYHCAQVGAVGATAGAGAPEEEHEQEQQEEQELQEPVVTALDSLHGVFLATASACGGGLDPPMMLTEHDVHGIAIRPHVTGPHVTGPHVTGTGKEGSALSEGRVETAGPHPSSTSLSVELTHEHTHEAFTYVQASKRKDAFLTLFTADMAAIAEKNKIVYVYQGNGQSGGREGSSGRHNTNSRASFLLQLHDEDEQILGMQLLPSASDTPAALLLLTTKRILRADFGVFDVAARASAAEGGKTGGIAGGVAGTASADGAAGSGGPSAAMLALLARMDEEEG